MVLMSTVSFVIAVCINLKLNLVDFMMDIDGERFF